MFKNMKISTKVFLATSPLILVNLGILVYQFMNMVVSAWNIVPSLILIFIIVGNVINMLGIKLPGALSNLSQFGAPPASEKEQSAYRENEDFYAINTSFPTRLTGKSIFVKTIFLLIFVGLTILFSTLGGNIKYDQVVTGTIIDKYVAGSVDTSVSSDGTVSSSDNRSLIMLVSYQVDGEIYRAEVKDNFSHNRDNNFIDLCVNNDGTYVCVYGKLTSFEIMKYVSIVCAVLTVLGFVFKLPNQYLVMLVFVILGAGIISLFNFADWSNWLLKDFTLFGGCFLTLGVMCVLQLILLRIIHSVGIKRNSNFQIT